MAYVPVADYVVVNDDFDSTAANFRGFIADAIEAKGQTARQFTHGVSTIPIYQNEVVYRPDPPHYPSAALDAGEIPHEAALRCLSETLDCRPTVNHLLRIKDTRGSFISPAQIDAHDEGPVKHIHLIYVYLLQERIAVPEGWTWRPSSTLDLPDAARDVLRELS